MTTTQRHGPRRVRRWLAGVAAAGLAMLSACGGGADGGIGGTGAGGGGGIGGTGIAYGTITGFGSVWVNGVRYDTRAAVLRKDGAEVGQAQLRVGMVARVEGDAAAATATLVNVDSALKGRVEALGPDTFVVMGQAVRIDAGTVFDGGVRPAVGDYVEVHGLPQPAGAMAATYVERKGTLASPPFVVTGFVGTHDAAGSTLTIGQLVVNYAGADVGDMPAGGWVGLLVEVKGDRCSGTPVCGTLGAVKLEPSGPRFDASPKAEIEGFVSALMPNGFMLGGQRVVVTPTTRYEGGVAADLVVGTKVEAEGPISGGVMTATKVEFKAGVRIEADVAAVIGDRITLAGLPGIEVQITAQTELDKLRSPADIVPGLHVRLRGRPVGPSLVVATEIEARSPDVDVELRGTASSAADPLITVLGVVIDTTGLPDSAFRDNGVAIGRVAFFAALANGHPLEAQGERSGTAVIWRELELED